MSGCTSPPKPGLSARRDAEGSVTPLVIGFAVVVALLVGVVVDASAAYLRRQGLNSAADAAALAATDGIQGEQVYTHGLGERAQIDRGKRAVGAQADIGGVGQFFDPDDARFDARLAGVDG